MWSMGSSCYTSDSALSTPRSSPGLTRKHPPKPKPPLRPKPKPIPAYSPQILNRGPPVMPKGGRNCRTRSPSPEVYNKSKGMELFIRQMKKLSQLPQSDDDSWDTGSHGDKRFMHDGVSDITLLPPFISWCLQLLWFIFVLTQGFMFSLYFKEICRCVLDLIRK